jgi:hypothetical protein
VHYNKYYQRCAVTIFVLVKIFNTNVFNATSMNVPDSQHLLISACVGNSSLFIVRVCVVMQFWVPHCCPAPYTLRPFTSDTPFPHVKRIAYL